MYRIYIDNGDEQGMKAFYAPGVESLALADIHYKPVAGSAGSLSFTVPPTHPLRSQVHPLSTDFWLLKGEKKIFLGRYTGREENFYRTGKIICEGSLNFLVDSVQEPYDYTGGISGFYDHLLNAHNSMVEPRKRFRRGIVNVVDANNNINRSNSKYSTTAEAFKEKLVEIHGGFLRIRHEDSGNYLDYVYDYGGTNAQRIRFGENLLDLSKYADATKLITALIPRGAKVEYENELGETQTRTVDIAPVNGGKKYIICQEAVDKWGMIWGTHEWEDVTLPENLLKKAQAYLEECAALPEKMELTALDLSLIDITVDDLEVGYWTQVLSVPHGISGLYMLYEMDINISDPGKSKISLGGKISTLSGAAAKNKIDMSRRIQSLAESTNKEINRKVENATKLITGGFGGYVVLDNSDPVTGTKMHPWRILIMNAPDRSVATNVIQINQSGIGFSTTGIDGPYRNAWTIDGNLVADFVTTGTMLADRIRGGTLEVGGQGLGQNGTIAVYDKAGALIGRIDIDGLYAIAGQIAGWSINTDTLAGKNLILDGAQGLIRSILEGDVRTWTSLNDGSVKSWVDNKEVAYLGRGGYNDRGSKDGGLIFAGNTGGGESVELDGATGRLNATGGLYTGGRMRCKGADVEGSMSVSGRAYFTGDGVEVSGDISCGGRIDASNISEIWGEIQAIKEKIGM